MMNTCGRANLMYNRGGLPGVNVGARIMVVLALCLFLSAEVVKGDWESDANARIEANRKRDVEITVVDSNGTPVHDLNVQIEQIWHRFGFGSCLAYGNMTNTSHQDFVADYFEWAVCENETKWSSNESTRDVWEFTQADYIADWCATNDIVFRGHTLVWETGSQTPSWVSGLECETYPTECEMLEEVDERIDYTVGRYAGQIVSWDVDNEMLSGNMFDCLGEEGRAHFFEEGDYIDPTCGFYMNEYSGNSFSGYNGDAYASRAQGLISLGAPIGGLGIQGHVDSPFDPELYYTDVLQELAVVGVPIIATEFDTDATSATQVADDLENFYRICFSHPSVEAIIMWGYHQNSWRWEGIVNTSTWVLTEAGVRYEALLDEWTTSDLDITDSYGIADFRGFHGTYEITLSAPGQDSEIHEIELEPGTGTQLFELVTSLWPPEPDYTPPEPNIMTWASPPAATGPSTITMTATTASDISTPVTYLFECTNYNDANSGWQQETTYVAQDLSPNTQYTFKVKARDNSSNHNETGWSEPNWATTEPPSTDVEILGDWETGTSHTKESGTNPSRALIFIAHDESETGTPTLTSVTYGGQTMNKVIEISVGGGSGYGNYVAAFILNESGVAAATSGTFTPTWSTTPGAVMYSSVFLQNADQTALVDANDSAGTTSGADPISTDPLVTDDGDMVILGATCNNLGSYTLENGFTEGTDQTFGNETTGGTGAAGHKAATGVAETQQANYSASLNRQCIIGFVVQAAPAGNLPPAAPTGLVATAGNETVSLDWNDNTEPDLAGYNVYRSTTSGGDPVPYSKLNGPLVTVSEYVDDTVTNGIPYFYVVKAVDTNDLESSYSNEASATPDYQTCADVLAGDDGLLSDLDGDCYVDYEDLETIVYYWLEADCSTMGDCEGADFEPDDDVDFIDFSTFGLQWMYCNNPEDASCTKNW